MQGKAWTEGVSRALKRVARAKWYIMRKGKDSVNKVVYRAQLYGRSGQAELSQKATSLIKKTAYMRNLRNIEDGSG